MRKTALWLGVRFGMALLAVIAMVELSGAGGRDVAAGEGAWIGLSLSPLSDDMRAAWDYEGAGLVVTGVAPGGPASLVGIQPGDLLVVVGSVSLRTEEDLIKARNRLDPGQRVSVVVARNEGRLIKIMNLEPLDVVAAPEAIEPEPGPAAESGGETAPSDAPATGAEVRPAIVRDPMVELGVRGADLNAGLASALSVPMSRGVLVLDVESGSPAERVGIRAGDVITRLGSQTIDGVQQLEKALEGSPSAVAIRLQRQKTAREVQVPLEDPPLPGKLEKAALEKNTAANSELDLLRREVEKLRAEMEAQKRH